MTPEERARRSVAIRGLLADTNVQDAFASIEADLVEEWKRTFDPHERDNIWRSVQVMEKLKIWLDSNASYDLTALRRQK